MTLDEQVAAFREDAKNIFQFFDNTIGDEAKPQRWKFQLIERFQLKRNGVLIDADALLQYVLKLAYEEKFLVSDEYGYATAHVMELIHRILKSILMFIWNNTSSTSGSVPLDNKDKETPDKPITLLFFDGDMGLLPIYSPDGADLIHPTRASPLTYLLLREMFKQEVCSMSDYVHCEVINKSCFGTDLSSINFLENHELIFSCKHYPKAYISQFSAINISVCDVVHLCADGRGESSGLEHYATREVLKFPKKFEEATNEMIRLWKDISLPLHDNDESTLKLVDKVCVDVEALCRLIDRIPNEVDDADLGTFKEAHKKAIGFQALRFAQEKDLAPMNPSLPEPDLSILVTKYLVKFTELCVRSNWSCESADVKVGNPIIQLCHLWDGRLIASWYMHCKIQKQVQEKVEEMDTIQSTTVSFSAVKFEFPDVKLVEDLCNKSPDQLEYFKKLKEPEEENEMKESETDEGDDWEKLVDESNDVVVHKVNNPCHNRHQSFQMGDEEDGIEKVQVENNHKESELMKLGERAVEARESESGYCKECFPRKDWQGLSLCLSGNDGFWYDGSEQSKIVESMRENLGQNGYKHIPIDYIDTGEDFGMNPNLPELFQLAMFQAIRAGKSLLVVAPTGVGKSYASEFAVKNFNEKFRSVVDPVMVLVQPTNALVNQSYSSILAVHERLGMKKGDLAHFTSQSRSNNFEGLKFKVLVTNAESLHMLLNDCKHLHFHSNREAVSNDSIKTDLLLRLQCVIFDEVHIIADKKRGACVERLLLMVRCPIICLSATLAKPEKFHGWLEDVKRSQHGTESGEDCNFVRLIEHKERSTMINYLHLKRGKKIDIESALLAFPMKLSTLLNLRCNLKNGQLPFQLKGRWVVPLHMHGRAVKNGVLSFRFGDDLFHVTLREGKSRDDNGRIKHCIRSTAKIALGEDRKVCTTYEVWSSDLDIVSSGDGQVLDFIIERIQGQITMHIYSKDQKIYSVGVLRHFMLPIGNSELKFFKVMKCSTLKCCQCEKSNHRQDMYLAFDANCCKIDQNSNICVECVGEGFDTLYEREYAAYLDSDQGDVIIGEEDNDSYSMELESLELKQNGQLVKVTQMHKENCAATASTISPLLLLLGNQVRWNRRKEVIEFFESCPSSSSADLLLVHDALYSALGELDDAVVPYKDKSDTAKADECLMKRCLDLFNVIIGLVKASAKTEDKTEYVDCHLDFNMKLSSLHSEVAKFEDSYMRLLVDSKFAELCHGIGLDWYGRQLSKLVDSNFANLCDKVGLDEFNDFKDRMLTSVLEERSKFYNEFEFTESGRAEVLKTLIMKGLERVSSSLFRYECKEKSVVLKSVFAFDNALRHFLKLCTLADVDLDDGLSLPQSLIKKSLQRIHDAAIRDDDDTEDNYNPNPQEILSMAYYFWQNEMRLTKDQSAKNEGNKFQKKEIKEPTILFHFNRKNIEDYMKNLIEDEKVCKIEGGNFADQYLESDDVQRINGLKKVSRYLKDALLKGIGMHVKATKDMHFYLRLVEELFQRRKLKFCFATGSLAYGINMPTVNVVFIGYGVHLDGLTFKQCSGRAGRRGYGNAQGRVYMYGFSQQTIMNLLCRPLEELTPNLPVTSSFMCISTGRIAMTAPYETLNEANEQYCSGVARIFENPFYKWLIEDGNLQTSYTNSLHDTALFSLYFLYKMKFILPNGIPTNKADPVKRMFYEEPLCFLMSQLLENIFDNRPSSTDGLLGLVKRRIEFESEFVGGRIRLSGMDPRDFKSMEVGDKLLIKECNDKYVTIQGIYVTIQGIYDHEYIEVSEDLSALSNCSLILQAMVPCLDNDVEDAWLKDHQNYTAYCGEAYDIEQSIFTTMVYVLYDNTSSQKSSDSQFHLPKPIQQSWMSYNNKVYECFVEYMSNKMPPSNSSQELPTWSQCSQETGLHESEFNAFIGWAKNKNVIGEVTRARSPFAALSGGADKFSSVFDLCWSSRDGSFASSDMIPTLDPPRNVHRSLDLIREGYFTNEAKRETGDSDIQTRLENFDSHLRKFYSCVEYIFKEILVTKTGESVADQLKKMAQNGNSVPTLPRRAQLIFHIIKEIRDDFVGKTMQATGECHNYLKTGSCSNEYCIKNHVTNPNLTRIHENGKLCGIPKIIRRFNPDNKQEEEEHQDMYGRSPNCQYYLYDMNNEEKRYPFCSKSTCTYHHRGSDVGLDGKFRGGNNPLCSELQNTKSCSVPNCKYKHPNAKLTAVGSHTYNKL